MKYHVICYLLCQFIFVYFINSGIYARSQVSSQKSYSAIRDTVTLEDLSNKIFNI